MPPDSSKFTRLAQFHPTRWSVVVRAQSTTPGAADEPLESLCRQYWPPLYAYVRSRGHPPHDAQDLTQEFFARLEARDRELRELVRGSGSPSVENPKPPNDTPPAR